MKGSTIERIYLPHVNIEGGLTIVFTKNNKRGFVIFGYTELGEWVEHFEYDSEILLENEYSDANISKIRKDNNLM